MFCLCNVIYYFILEAHFFALAGRIFLCQSIETRRDFCFPFRHLTDLLTKFRKGLKFAQNFEPFLSTPDPIGRPLFQNGAIFSEPQHKLVLRRWLGYYVLKLGEDWFPISEIRPGVCAPKMCKIGKWAIRNNNFKMAEDKAILSANGK